MFVLKHNNVEVGRSRFQITPVAGGFASRDQRWLVDNTVPGWSVEDIPDPLPVPEEVTARQAMRAIYASLGLTKADLLAAADAAQGLTAAQKMAVRIDIEESNSFRRDNPTLGLMAQMLSLTSEQVDDLFRTAGSIE